VGPGGYVPFTDLPRLGGPHQLRGYTRDRFRDRLAVLGAAEYRYPIWNELVGFLFADAGRVLAGADQVGNLVSAPERLRAGGGGGLEMHFGNRFRMRGQIAGSPDGAFFQMSFEPAYRVTSSFYRI
jgi:outer membrane protein assembly factor BamA